jgi:PAS domain S-box-containing protein
LRNKRRPGSAKGAGRGATRRRRARTSQLSVQKIVKKALHESEERFPGIAIVAIDTEGRFTLVSPSIERITGYRPEELVGSQFPSFVAESEMAKLARAFDSMMKGESIEGLQVEMKRKDGFPAQVEVNGSPIRRNRRVVGMQGIIRDITERKRVEEALANERNILRTLIDTLPDNIFIKDAESRFVISNLAHARLLRAKTPDEIVRKTDFDIFPQELAASYYADEQAVIRSGQPLVNREERTIDPEGKTRWLLTSKVPLRNDQGKVVGIVGINRDITERKRAEEALSQSETKYRGLVEQSLVGIGVSQGNRVIFANRALLNMFGYDSLEEFAKIPLVDHVAPKSREYILARMKALAHMGQMPQEFEYDIIRRDGKTRTLQASLTHITLDNETYTESLFQDITERKRLQDEIRRYSEHLEELVREKTENLAESEARYRRLFESSPISL